MQEEYMCSWEQYAHDQSSANFKLQNNKLLIRGYNFCHSYVKHDRIKSIGEQVIVLLTLTLLTKEIVNLRFSTLSLRKVTYLSFILFVLLLPPFIALWNFNAGIHINFVLLCTFISGTIFLCIALNFVLLLFLSLSQMLNYSLS